MPTTRCIAVYGNTLALAGIALALKRHPALKVVTIEVEDANLAQQLAAHSPNVIIFDQGQTDAQTILTCAEQCNDLVAIGIEANSDRMLLWSGHSARALTIPDLIQAIDALPDSIHQSLPRLSIVDRVRLSIKSRMTLHLTRRQKLTVAVVTIGLCLIGLLGLAQLSNISSANMPLNGTAVASGITSEIAMAFGIGIILGAVFIGAWFYLRQARKK